MQIQYLARGALLVVGLFAVGVPSFAQMSDEDAIRAVRAGSNRALLDKDVEALRGTWLPGLHVTGSNGDVVTSGDDMANIFAGAFSSPAYISYERRPTDVRLSPGRKQAAEHGEWTGRTMEVGQEMVVTGTYMAQWRKTGAGWRIRSEVFVALSCEGSEKCETLP